MRKFFLALVMGAFFVAPIPKYHLFRMRVAYVADDGRVGLVYQHYEKTSVWDGKEHVYDAWDNGVNTPKKGDDLLTFCVGEGENMQIISYRQMPQF